MHAVGEVDLGDALSIEKSSHVRIGVAYDQRIALQHDRTMADIEIGPIDVDMTSLVADP